MVLYNILYTMAFVFYLPVLLLRGKLHGGFVERFGFLSEELRYRLAQKQNIWFHAVSVGEVLAIVTLLERIRARYPDRQFVVSTVTTTGYALAKKRFRKEDVILYAPLDFSFSIKRFIRAIKPEIFIAAETELWPNLLRHLSKRDIPMVMVNGRISDQSFYRYQRFLFLFRDAVHSFRAFCMQSPKDADRILALGANPKAVTVVGSMKFDDMVLGETFTPRQLGFSDDALIWVAGSTHPGEESIILDVFKKLKKKFPNLGLILAPRHIERSEEVYGLAGQAGFAVQRFSTVNSAVSPSEVVVIDTIGHLKSLYRLATVVFVGKSLLAHGGQNIIEPASFGKPIVVGPHMENFQAITDIFLLSRAIIQIEEPSELEDAVYRLLVSEESRLTLGERAKVTVQKNQGATNRTEKILTRILAATTFVKPV